MLVALLSCPQSQPIYPQCLPLNFPSELFDLTRPAPSENLQPEKPVLLARPPAIFPLLAALSLSDLIDRNEFFRMG